MVPPRGTTESDIARKVLTVVTHERLEGLLRENENLLEENRRLRASNDRRSDSLVELENQISDQSVTISELVRANGNSGVPRPDIRASNVVCALCFDFLLAAGGTFRCNCQEYAYCSRECQELHWGRQHKYDCPAREERHPRRPYDP